jgi:hypothetical protein
MQQHEKYGFLSRLNRVRYYVNKRIKHTRKKRDFKHRIFLVLKPPFYHGFIARKNAVFCDHI